MSLFRRYWQDQALAAYRRAYELALEKDRKQRFPSPAANSLISRDAAESIRRIFERRTMSDDDRAELARMKEQTKDLPGGFVITPLIFSMEAARPLEDLLDPSSRVRFDLAGAGRPAEWPWLRPETALLVWDPAGTGRITSGRQLFGSVTWWIFWENGYEPLALLDDDGDGWIAGRELEGLAVWRDRNGDGRSDRGEVIPAAKAGIARLAARPAGRHGAIPWNPRGLATTDGRLLPTYDWTPAPAGESRGDSPPQAGFAGPRPAGSAVRDGTDGRGPRRALHFAPQPDVGTRLEFNPSHDPGPRRALLFHPKTGRSARRKSVEGPETTPRPRDTFRVCSAITRKVRRPRRQDTVPIRDVNVAKNLGRNWVPTPRVPPPATGTIREQGSNEARQMRRCPAIHEMLRQHSRRQFLCELGNCVRIEACNRKPSMLRCGFAWVQR